MNRPLSPALQKLIASYAEALPEKLDNLRQTHITSSPVNPDALQTYYTAVHQLAGSAGSYGFRPISESARVLDRYLSDVIAQECDYVPERALALLDDVAARIAQAGDE